MLSVCSYFLPYLQHIMCRNWKWMWLPRRMELYNTWIESIEKHLKMGCRTLWTILVGKDLQMSFLYKKLSFGSWKSSCIKRDNLTPMKFCSLILLNITWCNYHLSRNNVDYIGGKHLDTEFDSECLNFAFKNKWAETNKAWINWK